jgi:hypothetical protein
MTFGWVTDELLRATSLNYSRGEGGERQLYPHEISNILSTIYQPTQAEKLPSFLLS